MAYGQSEAPEATWADAAVSEGVRAALPSANFQYTCMFTLVPHSSAGRTACPELRRCAAAVCYC